MILGMGSLISGQNGSIIGTTERNDYLQIFITVTGAVKTTICRDMHSSRARRICDKRKSLLCSLETIQADLN